MNRYALLTRLPLFQGISSTDLLAWEEALRLDIEELPASALPLIRQGENCTQMLCIVEGELRREHLSADETYLTRSILRAPAIIEPDRLFGLTPTYNYTYYITRDIKLLNVRKSLVQSHLMKSEIFRLNMLNLLSAISQKRASALLPHASETAEERLKHFLATLFNGDEGEVELYIHMTDLAHFIGHSRLITSGILNRWDQDGSIRLGRGHFTIHDVKALVEKIA